MNKGLLFRIFFSIFFFSTFLYVYLNQQNEITQIRIQIPQIQKKIEKISQENTRLQFEMDQFENPINLMEISRRPEFSHLKHPLLKDIISLPLPPPIDAASPCPLS